MRWHSTMESDPFDTTRMSFGDHLEELRRSVVRGLIGLAAATTLTLIFGKEIVKLICQPLFAVQIANGLQPSLQALAPISAFSAYLKIAFLSGVIIAMPWLLYQIWSFVETGLYDREKRFARWLVLPSSALFLLGVLFLYVVVLPIVLQFFISFNRTFGSSDLMPSAIHGLLLAPSVETAPHELIGDGTQVDIRETDPEDAEVGDVWVNTALRQLRIKMPERVWSIPLQPHGASPVIKSQFAIDFYISFVLLLALAFGIAFETPLVVFFLAWSGLVRASEMAKSRKYVVFGCIVAAALMTPPDVISQILLAGPMYLLFELGLFFAMRIERTVETDAAP